MDSPWGHEMRSGPLSVEQVKGEKYTAGRWNRKGGGRVWENERHRNGQNKRKLEGGKITWEDQIESFLNLFQIFIRAHRQHLDRMPGWSLWTSLSGGADFLKGSGVWMSVTMHKVHFATANQGVCCQCLDGFNVKTLHYRHHWPLQQQLLFAPHQKHLLPGLLQGQHGSGEVVPREGILLLCHNSTSLISAAAPSVKEADWLRLPAEGRLVRLQRNLAAVRGQSRGQRVTNVFWRLRL